MKGNSDLQTAASTSRKSTAASGPCFSWWHHSLQCRLTQRTMPCKQTGIIRSMGTGAALFHCVTPGTSWMRNSSPALGAADPQACQIATLQEGLVGMMKDMGNMPSTEPCGNLKWKAWLDPSMRVLKHDKDTSQLFNLVDKMSNKQSGTYSP